MSSHSYQQLSPIWIVAFSGHRPKPGVSGRSHDEILACRERLRATFESLQQQATDLGGSFELLCSAADGGDQLAMQIADELDMRVHLILPMAKESFRQDFMDESGTLLPSWQTTETAISKAMEPTSQATVRVAIGDGVRPDCYHDTNLQMLEAADVLVVIHNGVESSELGGTSEAIRIADADHLRIPTIVLDSAQAGKIVREDRWNGRGASEDLLDKINQDMASDEARRAAPGFQRTGEELIWAVHHALDNVANNTSRVFRGSLKTSIWLHFWATVLAAITAAFAKVLIKDHTISPALTFFELLLVSYATILIWQASRVRSNERWRRTRLAAEIADSQIHCAGLVDPLKPLVVRHDKTWKRFALSVALQSHRQKSAKLANQNEADRRMEMRRQYVEHRIENQLTYFKRQGKEAFSRFHRWSRVSKIASTVAVPAVLASLILKLSYEGAGKDPTTAFFVQFVPILLPLTAGLASSLTFAHDAARRSTRYKQVVERLEAYLHVLSSIETPAALQRLVLEVEDILLDEMIEWHATAENMGH